jgi:hypothetical protein
VSLRTADLSVPASPASPRLLPPFFLQGASEGWMLMREGEEGDDAAAGDRYPFQLSGQRFLPAVVPHLVGGSPVPLLLMGYGLEEEDWRLESHVERRFSGTSVDGGWELEVHGRSPGEEGAPDALVASLEVAGLAPGDYRLVVDMVDREDGHRLTAEAPFAVAKAEH